MDPVQSLTINVTRTARRSKHMAEPNIQPTGAATVVAHNFEMLRDRIQALDEDTVVLRDRTQALDETTVGLNARTLALETRFHELNSEIATRLKDIDLGLAKQTARLDALTRHFNQRIDAIVGKARSDGFSDSDTETDDEASFSATPMVTDNDTRADLGAAPVLTLVLPPC